MLSENAAAEDAVVMEMTKVENVFFHSVRGLIFNLIQALAVWISITHMHPKKVEKKNTPPSIMEPVSLSANI